MAADRPTRKGTLRPQSRRVGPPTIAQQLPAASLFLVHVSSLSSSRLHDTFVTRLVSGLCGSNPLALLAPRPPSLSLPPTPPPRLFKPWCDCLQEQAEPAGMESRYPRRHRTTVLGSDAPQGKSQGTEEEEESVSDQVH